LPPLSFPTLSPLFSSLCRLRSHHSVSCPHIISYVRILCSIATLFQLLASRCETYSQTCLHWVHAPFSLHSPLKIGTPCISGHITGPSLQVSILNHRNA
jgi:hypothetical protein